MKEEGLYRYFSEVVQRVGDARLKIYLYHIPPGRGGWHHTKIGGVSPCGLPECNRSLRGRTS